MSDGKRFKWVLVGLVAALAFVGCDQANARDRKSNEPSPKVAAVGRGDAHPSSDADTDNGPGCAESSLARAPQQKRNVLDSK